MNTRKASFSANLISSTTRWSTELSSHRRNVPDDVAKFHMNLVMLDYSKADIAFMVDTIQEDAKAWEADGCPDFLTAWQVEGFFSARSIHDEDLGQVTVSPAARRRHGLRRKARDIFGRLASLISSNWPFAQALRAYSPALARHWPEVGEHGYFACLEQSTKSNLRFVEERSRHGHRRHTPSGGGASEMSGWERRSAMKLLRTKLAVVSQAEADLLDVPAEIILHCAIADGCDNHVYAALHSLYQMWLEASKPELLAYDQVASLIAYWLNRRWESHGSGLNGSIPYTLGEDIAAVREFCDWTNMPQVSAFARMFQTCDSTVLPEHLEDDAERLQAYLDDREIWFRINILGDGDPVEIDF